MYFLYLFHFKSAVIISQNYNFYYNMGSSLGPCHFDPLANYVKVDQSCYAVIGKSVF